MAIVIEDMKLPVRCEECPMCEEDYVMLCMLKHRPIPFGVPRPKWCPMKEKESD